MIAFWKSCFGKPTLQVILVCRVIWSVTFTKCICCLCDQERGGGGEGYVHTWTFTRRVFQCWATLIQWNNFFLFRKKIRPNGIDFWPTTLERRSPNFVRVGKDLFVKGNIVLICCMNIVTLWKFCLICRNVRCLWVLCFSNFWKVDAATQWQAKTKRTFWVSSSFRSKSKHIFSLNQFTTFCAISWQDEMSTLIWNDFDPWGQSQCFIQVIKTVHWGLRKSDFRVAQHLSDGSSRKHRSFEVTTLLKATIIWGAEFHTICFISPSSLRETSHNWMIIGWTWNSWKCLHYFLSQPFVEQATQRNSASFALPVHDFCQKASHRIDQKDTHTSTWFFVNPETSLNSSCRLKWPGGSLI